MNKKSINKIHSKIDSIAKRGIIGKVDYVKYIDELINDGKYAEFQIVLELKYGITVDLYRNVDDVKNLTFNQIRFQTSSKFQERLKKVLDEAGVVQIGQNIYQDDTDLGYIEEQTTSNGLEITTFSNYNGMTFSYPTTRDGVVLEDSVLEIYKKSIDFLVSYAPVLFSSFADISTSSTTTTTTIVTTSTTTSTTTLQLTTSTTTTTTTSVPTTSTTTSTTTTVVPTTSTTTSTTTNSIAASTTTTTTTESVSTSTTTTTTTEIVSTSTTTTTTTEIQVGSFVFDGETSQYLEITDTSNLLPGLNDFTVEWFQIQQPGDEFSRVFSFGEFPSNFAASIENGSVHVWLNGNDYQFLMTSFENLQTHIAICRNSDDLNVYQNGQLLSSTKSTDNIQSTDNLYIGIDLGFEDVSKFKGKLTNFHIVVGSSLYSGNFSIPHLPLTSNLNTKLLLLAQNPQDYLIDSGPMIKIVNNNLGVTWSYF